MTKWHGDVFRRNSKVRKVTQRMKINRKVSKEEEDNVMRLAQKPFITPVC
jgi:hypothetical protein